jgi:antitoxin component YwqK of YwqJK toxin-antitoxin module
MKQIIFLMFMFLQVVGHTQVEEVVFRNNKGQIEQKGHLLNNLKTGKWVAYYENGSVFSVGHYDKGKKDGMWTTYSPFGVKVSQVKYVRGKKYEGWMYDMEGKFIEKRIFKDYITND